jgi:hypothetical protein
MPITFPFEKFKNGLIKIYLEEANYNQNLSEWIEKHGNTEQSRKDFLWHVYQTLLSSVAKDYSHDLKLMYDIQRKLYSEMFLFLIAEDKNRTVAQQGINHCDIQKAALSELKMDGIIMGGNRCELTKQINQKTYPLKDLLMKDAIPYQDCPRIGGCNCCYAFIPLRDKNGRLIRK